MTARRSRFAVFVVILLRWWIGLNYSLSVPAWEAYDEPGHFSYAVTLATTEHLLTADAAVQNPEAIQPPLYYALLAGILRLSATDITDYHSPDRNPQFYANNGSINYALHRLQQTQAEQRHETALHLLRIVTLLLTLPAVAIAYRLFSLVSIHPVAFITLCLFALWPQSLFNGSVVTNDALTLTLGTLLTWLLLRSFRLGLSTRVGVLILLSIGLGTLVKLNLLLMIFPFAVLLLMTTKRNLILVTCAILVVAAGLSILSSTSGILLPFNNLSAQGEYALTTIWRNLTHDQGWILLPDGLRYLVYSSVGLFGWGNITLPSWIQLLIIILLGAAFVGGIVGLVRHHISRQLLLLISIIVAQIAGGTALTLFYQTVHLLNGRYLLPALSALCVLLVGGWSGLGVRVSRCIFTMLMIGVAIAGITIPPYIASFYQRPTAVPFTSSTHMPRNYQAGMRLVDYDVMYSSPTDNFVSVRLYLSTTQPIPIDYFVRLEVIGADGNGYGLFDTIPGHGNHPTTNWLPGDTFRDDYRVPIRADAPLGKGHIRLTLIALHDTQDRVSFDLTDAPFDVWGSRSP